MKKICLANTHPLPRVVLTSLLLALLVNITASAVFSQALRSEAEMRAGPRDIREIFLTFPLPEKPEKNSLVETYSSYIDSYEKRLKIVESPFSNYPSYPNVIDLEHAYLRLNLWDQPGQFIVLTAFTKTNGERVVAFQPVLENGVEKDPHSEDYFYTLAKDGSYKEEASERYLPTIKFEDFWGDQPLPSFVARSKFDFFHLYNISWPQVGTVAIVRSYSPYRTTETVSAEQRKIKAIYDRRAYREMKLIWDKDRGVFVKGEKSK